MNLQTAAIESDTIRVEYLTGSALRLTGLYLKAKPVNLLTLVPDFTLPLEGEEYVLIGGHRLWASPEVPGWSFGYEGGLPLEIETRHNHLRLIQQQPEAGGLRKEISITLDEHLPRLQVEHRLINDSDAPVTTSPWGLSILPVGGHVLLPFPPHPDDSAYKPDRKLSLWQYTTMENLRMQYLPDAILLPTTGRSGPCKIGTWLKDGWCGYYRDSIFFKKRINDPKPGHSYPDFGCNCEVFLIDGFLELETLGPLEPVAPGSAAVLLETWDLVTDLQSDPDLAPYAGILG